MNLIINKKSIKFLIYFEIIFVLLHNLFITQFGFPSFITYILDVINLVIFLYLLFTKNKLPINKKLNLKPIFIVLSIFSGCIIIGDIINLVSPFLIFWAIRNTFRFFLFFFACLAVLDKEDVEKIFDLLVKMQVINFVLTLIQFFVLGYRQDFLGGIFGVWQGCNGYTNVYLLCICTYSLSKYFFKKMSLLKTILIFVSSLILASLCELKFFYLETILVVLLTVFCTKFSLRKFIFVILFVLFIYIGLNILSIVFPKSFAQVVDIEAMFNYASGTGGGYNISRFNAFYEINELFFRNDIIYNLFGYGFGGCEYSSISLFTSDFYLTNGTYHYRWFTHQHLFLETGYLGFFSFVLFFVVLFVLGRKYRKQLFEYGVFLQVFVILTILNLWYNQAIRIECAYITFFALSGPLIMIKPDFPKTKEIRSV